MDKISLLALFFGAFSSPCFSSPLTQSPSKKLLAQQLLPLFEGYGDIRVDALNRVDDDFFDFEDYKRYSSKIYAHHPDTAKQLEYDFWLYQPGDDDYDGLQLPLIIILPTMLGISDIEHRLAGHLADEGLNVLISHTAMGLEKVDRPIREIDEFNRRSIIAVKMLVDYALSRSDIVDPKRLGILGVSDGGIRAALAFGVDLRLKAAGIIAGGGNIPSILAHSRQKKIEAYRQFQMQKHGLKSVWEYKRKLKNEITIDPLVFAHRRHKRDIWMLMMSKDEVVPYRTQRELWREFGKGPHEVYNDGHAIGIFWASMFKKGKMEKFFKNRLGN